MKRFQPSSIGSLVTLATVLAFAITGCSSDETSPVSNPGNTGSVARARITFENSVVPPIAIEDVACLGGAIAVCGDAGFAAIYQGGTWTTLDTGAPVPLKAVWGTSPTDVYFAGDTGCFLHWDGTTITSIDVGTDGWSAMWGSATDDIWLMSISSVLHWQGATATRYSFSQLPVSSFYWGIGGSAADNVYVVGANGLMKWDGSSWSAVDAGTGSTDLYSVVAIDDEVFIAGEGRLLLHFDGASWSSFTAPGTTFQRFNVVTGLRVDNVLAFGNDRQMYRWNGTAWNDISDPFFGSSHDIISACAVGNGVVVGGVANSGSPNVARFEGSAWVSLNPSSVTVADFFDVWTLNRTNAVAVGENGLIARRDAIGWADVAHGLTTVDLYGAWGSGANNIYAVGEDGVVLHNDGSIWTLVDTGLSPETLFDIDGSGPNNIWIVGYNLLWHWDGTAWADRWHELPDTLAEYETVYVAPGGDVFLADDHLMHYDGVAWDHIPIKNYLYAAEIVAIWGTSSRDVWTAGYTGVYRWDGTDMELRWPDDDNYPFAIAGRGPNNILIGTSGKLIQFANGVPTVIPFPNAGSDVYGASTGVDGITYFVGQNGLIARVD